MSEWQPIETAPKDGTPVDLWTAEDGRFADACWNSTRRRWETQWERLANSVPTHWMPLPPPPAAEETAR
jgi:hypothetical protein